MLQPRLIACCLLLTACRTQPLRAPASPSSAAPMCTTHSLQAATILSFTPLDASLVGGFAVRVWAGVELYDGDQLGEVNVKVQPGDATDGAVVSVFVWRGSPQRGTPTTPQVPVLIPGAELSSPSLIVRDGAPGGTARLELKPGQTSAPCDARGLGVACTRDCQCTAAGGACLLTSAGGGVCAVSCAEDTDCPAAAPQCSGQRADGVIQACDAVDGCCPLGCRAGQACSSCVCSPTPQHVPVVSCRCDSDCDGAGFCDANQKICLIPCANRHDCQGGEFVDCHDGYCQPPQ